MFNSSYLAMRELMKMSESALAPGSTRTFLPPSR